MIFWDSHTEHTFAPSSPLNEKEEKLDMTSELLSLRAYNIISHTSRKKDKERERED